MNRHSKTGLSSLDLLGDIPRGERILLKVFLREPVILKADFSKQEERLKEEKNLSTEEIAEAIKELKKRGWLSEDGENYVLMQQKSRWGRAHE